MTEKKAPGSTESSYMSMSANDREGLQRAIKKGATRREAIQMMVAAGMTAAAAGSVVTSATEALAMTPKKGGKLVFAGIPNTKHKTLKKAKHPYYGLEIRTTITYDRLTWVDENLNVVPQLATSWAAVEHDQTVWEAEIREGLSGNLCRCTGYQQIVEAVRMAAEKMRGAGP